MSAQRDVSAQGEQPLPVLHRTGSGPAVVLLHPLGVERRYWDPILPLLPRLTVLSYDLPGHGATKTGGVNSVEAMADQLAELLAQAGVAKAHVVGVSLGGLVAQLFAVRHPERLDRLVLVDTVPRYPPPVREQWKQRAATARSAGMGPLVAPTLASWFTPSFLAADGPGVAAIRTMLAEVEPEGYAMACEALEAADATELATAINAPTLLVCGDDDMPPFTAAVSWFAERIPRTETVWLSPAQHAGVLEHPQAFATALTTFLGASG